jgi:hypothetical protein
MKSDWPYFTSTEKGYVGLRTELNYLNSLLSEETFFAYEHASMISGNTFEENMAG